MLRGNYCSCSMDEEPNEEDFANLLIMLPQLVESCEESKKILEEVERTETSSSRFYLLHQKFATENFMAILVYHFN